MVMRQLIPEKKFSGTQCHPSSEAYVAYWRNIQILLIRSSRAEINISKFLTMLKHANSLYKIIIRKKKIQMYKNKNKQKKTNWNSISSLKNVETGNANSHWFINIIFQNWNVLSCTFTAQQSSAMPTKLKKLNYFLGFFVTR